MFDHEAMQQKFVGMDAELKEYKRHCQQAALELDTTRNKLDEKSKSEVEMNTTLKELHHFNWVSFLFILLRSMLRAMRTMSNYLKGLLHRLLLVLYF